jgi:adenosylhomocysteinase
MKFKVKDLSLVKQGKLQIAWAESRMPVLMKIKEEFEKKKPFKGLIIGVALHVTKETAVLVKTLKAGGAEVALCAANPLSTQDDVAAALTEEGINVFAWTGENEEEYYWCMNQVLNFKPNVTLDDGGDLVNTIHMKRQDLIKNVFGGQEETTTGVIRLRAMARDGVLKYAMFAINDTPTKGMFDNVYGTGQSTIDGILRATSMMIAGKTFVVCGYGRCGYGLASRARGMGANVIVTEVDCIKSLQAVMDGYRVMPLKEAAKIGDIFITITGDRDVIRKEHIELMKDGAIIGNTGHFNVEINVEDLESLSKSKREIRKHVEEYTLKNGKKIYLLGKGRIINLVAAEGHPSDVMDMSFADHALCCEYLVKNYKKLKPDVYNVPKEVDDRVAQLKLESMGIEIDQLTERQKKYLTDWKEGT